MRPRTLAMSLILALPRLAGAQEYVAELVGLPMARAAEAIDYDGTTILGNAWPYWRGFTQDTPNTETKVYIRRIALAND